MVTIIKKLTGGAYPFYEYACLSTDTKPVSLVPENSVCHEIDTGKHFYFGNGEWKELPPKGGSGGGSGGGSLPADFPAEGLANANKFLGFDNSGDYAALDAPSGGGAEKFVVTFTESNGNITADKTIAEIVEAKEAGDIVVGVYTSFGLPCEIPCIAAIEMQIESQAFPVAAFAGPVAGGSTKFATIGGIPDDGVEEWTIDFYEFDGNAPLVVTMTEDQQTPGTYVGDKTHKEVYDAFREGKSVVVNITIDREGTDFYSSSIVAGVTFNGSSEYTVILYSGGGSEASVGGANDYITLTNH